MLFCRKLVFIEIYALLGKFFFFLNLACVDFLTNFMSECMCSAAQCSTLSRAVQCICSAAQYTVFTVHQRVVYLQCNSLHYSLDLQQSAVDFQCTRVQCKAVQHSSL